MIRPAPGQPGAGNCAAACARSPCPAARHQPATWTRFDGARAGVQIGPKSTGSPYARVAARPPPIAAAPVLAGQSRQSRPQPDSRPRVRGSITQTAPTSPSSTSRPSARTGGAPARTTGRPARKRRADVAPLWQLRRGTAGQGRLSIGPRIRPAWDADGSQCVGRTASGSLCRGVERSAQVHPRALRDAPLRARRALVGRRGLGGCLTGPADHEIVLVVDEGHGRLLPGREAREPGSAGLSILQCARRLFDPLSPPAGGEARRC
jgi:hypothetical protein